jgi:hypothetical protein
MEPTALKRILIITSCTGEKSVEHKQSLTLTDFRKGPEHVARRERELAELLTPAEDLYSGQQHVRLMRGVRALRDSGQFVVDLWILSAGYGLVPADRKLAPYEVTFQGMKSVELRRWADVLNVPADFRSTLGSRHDLGLVLLGDEYLRACALDADVRLGGLTLLFCGTNTAKRLPRLTDLRTVILSPPEAKRFSCGLVGLKGEVGSRLLTRLNETPSLIAQLRDPATDVLGLLDGKENLKPAREQARANPKVDCVIQLPKSWWNKAHREKLMYFIPEWDDLVDPDYDFENDAHSSGAPDWTNEVYAHQMYPEPNYDGILVSREVVKKAKKKQRVDQLGIHRFLRVPRSFPVMGDCGAFGYITEDVPPYSTEDIIDYYTRHDFDFGVSVDHLILAGTEDKKRQRYQLTIQNAEAFLMEHRRLGLKWEPIGAVQGWDPKSYADAAKSYVAMGYKYIGLGGLVRTNTRGIIETLQAVQTVVPRAIKIHLFGIARLAGMRDFIKNGATSIDNASMLRKAWLGSDLNYLTAEGWYSAIRIPEAKHPDARGGSFRAKSIVKSGKITFEELKKLEQASLTELRAYARSRGLVPSSLLDHLVSYDELVAGQRKHTRERLHRTLSERPWEKCPCAICQRWGVEVLVFRGNNRNRRRGFHNTYVFYGLLQKVVAGEPVPLLGDEGAVSQMNLFSPAEAVG